MPTDVVTITSLRLKVSSRGIEPMTIPVAQVLDYPNSCVRSDYDLRIARLKWHLK